jgi:enolase
MSDTIITALNARQVWDSRGRPTVEAEVTLASGATGRAIAPSGASTGRREALDLRDGGARLGGFGVNRALEALNGEIAVRLTGLDAADQAAVDAALIALDGTAQKERLGGNATVAASMAVAWAAAAGTGVPLWRHLRDIARLPDTLHVPIPMIQIFGGGAHAGNRVDIQDFLVLPLTAPTFAVAVEWVAEIYLAAAALMRVRGTLSGVSDEGGLWPDFRRNEEPLEVLTAAIAKAGFTPGRDVGIALDVAASEFFADGVYDLKLDGQRLDREAMTALIAGWCAAYPIVSLEDPMAEDDDAGFVAVTHQLGAGIQVIGDDYLTTDAGRIRRAGELGACNAALLKANQCGTLTELIAAAAAARSLGWNTVMSGRSGESEDVTLSHLAVGLLADQIKVGSVTRSERTAKWNEVIRIEETLAPGGYRPFRATRAKA